METHVKVLGVLFILLSALGVLTAFGIGAVFGVAGLATSAAIDSPEAAIALPILGAIASILTLFILAISIPGLIAGFGLLSFKPWARILSIVLSALQLIHIPFGTLVGIYGLWVLLNKDTERLFAAAGPPTRA